MKPYNFNAIQGTIFLGGFLLFLIFELIRPYRPSSVAKTKRLLINLSLTVLNSIILYALFSAVTASTASYVTENRMGVLNMLDLPQWFHIFLTILFMDFMLYVWHLLNHNVPLFWRFHRVHHSDLNMDVSTATRFHIGELMISAVIKIGLIYFIGAKLLSMAIFESMLVLTIQFQHSSLKAPEWFERIFWIFFVPPSMHRIHHSVKIRERNTNYGTILSVWDRMFGTLIRGIDQGKIVIGVGAYREPGQLDLHHLLLMPFTKAIE
ncbi:MAG: sterol desaturase family protein [Syntrophales bacterium]|nr:sterol desaturase family protein [Syntrophales bacterium]